MCNVFEVAKKICEAGNWEVSNLRLQKMLYIAQVLHIGKFGKHLFREGFEAWDYGPVVPSVYRAFKMFGSKPIEQWAMPECEEKCSKEENEFVNNISSSLASITASNLVALTHRVGSGWHNNYKPGICGLQIPESDMKSEYTNVWLKNAK